MSFRLFGKHEPMKCVYAGPDYFKKKKKDTDPCEGVYAGPDFFQKKNPFNVNDNPCEDVYAGPDMFEEPVDDPGYPENRSVSSENPAINFCPNCGNKVDDAANTCDKCGIDLNLYRK